MPVQFNRHLDIRDLTRRGLLQSCDLNTRIKRAYNIDSEYEYRQFLMKNPGIVEKFLFEEQGSS